MPTPRRADGRIGVGLALHADLEYLALVRDLVEQDADWFEVSPETLWRAGPDGSYARNDFHRLFEEIGRRSGKPFVAHGLAFSLGTPVEGDEPRTERWLQRLRDDHATFRFRWLSDHLGWSVVDGRLATLPLPLPYTDEAAEVVARRMRLLAGVLGPTQDVAFENNVSYFALGDPADEPGWLDRVARRADCGMVLDLHNVHTQCLALGGDPYEYVDRLDLDRVIELHVSGGAQSEPEWLPSRRSIRLDSHDGPVPEPVWRLLEHVLPRCRRARGILVERLNGTLSAADVPGFRDEVRRAKEMFRC